MQRTAVLVFALAVSPACSKKAEQKPAEPAAAPVKLPAQDPAGKLAPLAADSRDKSGNVLWSQSIGGTDTDAIRGVAIAPDGMIAIAGYSKTEAQFGDAPATPLKGSDAFVASLGKDGKIAWVRHFGGDGEDLAEAVAIDKQGSPVVAGSFSNELIFDDDKMKSRGADDAFVGKFDRNGKRLWLRRLGGLDVDAAQSVAVDGAGNVFATGVFKDKAEIAGLHLTSAGESDMFVLALSPTGEVLWARSFGGIENDYGRSIAVNSAGAVFLLAEFSRSVVFDGVKLESAGNRDVALLEIGRDGKVVSGKSFGNELDSLGFGLTVDRAGNLLVTGGFESTMTIGATTLKSAGRSDVFVARFSSKGESEWAQRFGGTDDDMGLEVRADDAGNAIVVGKFSREAEFADKKIKSNGDTDAFVAKLSPDGKLFWVHGFGGPERDAARGLAVTDQGGIVAAGAFLKTVMFGDKKLTCPDAEGALLPKTNAFLIGLSP